MKQKLLSKTIFLTLNIIFAFIIVIPVLYCVDISFMTQKELFSYPPRFLPQSIHFDNYRNALRMAPFPRFILNSFIVSTTVMIGQLLTGSLAAYAFSILRFKGKNLLFNLMLCTMMIPGQAIIISNYLTIASWRLTDTYFALFLPYLATAFAVFNMRQAFLQLSTEIREAAVIDGCRNFRFFWQIAIPLVRPQLGALGIYVFLNNYNQYLWPLLVTNKAAMRTVQVGVASLRLEVANFGMILAGVTIILIPSILIFLIGQKQLISGLTAGAIKG
ncbi:carbohydrate ABC transporter permease [Breznakiella homolactica]|uniref:sn-glycerol-3-phosphate transport system permease protein UgpE n=1 Tax=Breznakiella homolactica TaxID=2798577 RepID=A0A7T7XMF4_9SPIR|nr:carbohydrate ABC transporter permease [Breznakiella homolactica]QQO08963.1 carbohydrate ABC transporter permease [Breznakiella homolactica]